LQAVNLRTVAKVGVDRLRLPFQQMRNIYPRRCPDPLRFLVFESETADETIWHAKTHHVAFWGNYHVERQILNW
jgi:hypothetical protein